MLLTHLLMVPKRISLGETMDSTRLFATMDVVLAVEVEGSVGIVGSDAVDEEAREDIVAVGGSTAIVVIVESEVTAAIEVSVARAYTVAAAVDVAGTATADVAVGEAKREEPSLSHRLTERSGVASTRLASIDYFPFPLHLDP